MWTIKIFGNDAWDFFLTPFGEFNPWGCGHDRAAGNENISNPSVQFDTLGKKKNERPVLDHNILTWVI